MTRRILRALVPVGAVVGVFVLWDLWIRLFDVAPVTAPAPGDVLRAIRDDWGVLSDRTWTTLKETSIGFVAGAIVGFALAVLLSRWSLVRRAVYPVLIATQAVPIPAIAAPLVILLGFGLTPKVVVVAFIVFFPVVVNMLDAFAGIDRDLLNLARIVKGKPIRVLLLIELPATITPMFSGLKLGATYAVTGAVIGESLATLDLGLFNYLAIKNSQLSTTGVYAAVLLLATIGVGGFLLVSLVERVATPWRTRTTARRWRRRNPARTPPPHVSEDVRVGDPGGRP